IMNQNADDKGVRIPGLPGFRLRPMCGADRPTAIARTNRVHTRISPAEMEGGLSRLLVLVLTALLIGFPGSKSDSQPLPSNGRTRITIMATSDFAGSFELNQEGSRGWSVLRTYSRQVKFNRRNAASRAYLFHTGDLTGLQFDSHDFPDGIAYFDAGHPLDDTDSRTAQLLIRRGADLLQYAGFDGVALRSTEEKDLRRSSDSSWTSLLRFRAPETDWTATVGARPLSHSYKILTGAGTFVWVSAVEPAGDLDSLNLQINSLRREIYNNRAANLIILLFATRRQASSHDEPDSFQRLSPEQFIQAFLNKDNGNLFHPLTSEVSSGQDIPYGKMLLLLPGKRAFFQTPEGATLCRIPAGELCQMEFDFRNNRKSVTQHWIGFEEALRNHSFIPADPGMEKILQQR
ncbi:MAG: hypothetical protein KDK23_17180, partial [Leptospiraceae bacterium]|nr:hypothetical protein [Leptospiraceae bacterium]